MAALFLIQTMVGAASQHYRAELGDFFGIDLAQLLPFNLARTFHVQLAIFFVSTSFLAAGIFLAPMITGREPKRQHWLAYGLLAALAIVVFGSLIGEFGGIHGWFGDDGSIFGIQGFEYLDLGRFWQVLLVIGLFFWAAIIFRGAARTAAAREPGQPALAVLLRRARDPGLLRRRPARPPGRQLHRHRLLALLGRPPLGRGLPRAVHDGDGRLRLRPARRGARAGRAHRRLPRHPPLLGRRRDRHHAPPLLLRRAGRAHGARRRVLGRRGDPAHLPDRRGLELPPARRAPGGSLGRRPSRTAGR